MVNKKYGNAPNRNLFKRRARVLFSELIEQYSNLNIGLMIKPLKQNISFQDITPGITLSRLMRPLKIVLPMLCSE